MSCECFTARGIGELHLINGKIKKEIIFSNPDRGREPLFYCKIQAQRKLKLQAALKALALQRNSACAVNVGPWHRRLHATNEPAVQFQMSPLGGAVGVMS
ncbi:hypothetical protein ILYODFUR_029659 [Ilyodon furcidens]|uniref:Uncharacterized protein n=1 Tax=Ilyodon furcidens TaxID=33524 RepID=A0ABV0UMZ0_9TELE